MIIIWYEIIQLRSLRERKGIIERETKQGENEKEENDDTRESRI